MALQSESIDDRLESLQQQDRRVAFGSNLQAIRLDANGEKLSERRVSKFNRRKSDQEYPVNQVVALMEELSQRIDSLEKKDRALGEEIRLRARLDEQRRTRILVGAILGTSIFVCCWMMNLI